LEQLKGLDVCVGPVNDLAEAMDDPQLVHREMFIEADVPGTGPWTHVGNPIKLASGRSEATTVRPPPKMGEHTAELLATVGVSADDLEGLRLNGVV
jgi:crotonobetainyl-CoA:carnitine CoA-transferase CaiB-like acyl-CoA transferase